MAGIPQWSKNVEVQANPGKKTGFVQADTTQEVPANDDLIVELYAEPGYVSTIEVMYLNFSNIQDATSGHVELLVACGPPGTGTTTIYGRTAAGTYTIGYRYGMIRPYDEGLEEMYPSDAGAMHAAQRMVFDEHNPIRIRYINKTDASDGERLKTIRLWTLDEKVGP